MPRRVCLIAAVPSTLKAFYRPLIEALHREGFQVSLLTSPGDELAYFRESGMVTIFQVSIPRRISPIADLVALARMVRVIRANRFDIVHTHTAKGGLLGMLAGWIGGVPVRVHTLHGLLLETSRGLRRRLLALAERITHWPAHRVCVVSESLRRRVLELGLCPEEKMTILGAGTACGVDLSRFVRSTAVVEEAGRIRSRCGIPDGARVMGYVGWLVADKGVAELIEAFECLAARHEDLHLLMIGDDGSFRDPLPRSTMDTIRRHPRIHYHGLVAEPVPYYAAMDVCVLPTHREGFGMAVLEAAALGVPSVATRVTGCVDSVVDGETGLLVNVGDAAALAAAIETLLGDAGLRRRMGAAAEQRVRTLFGSERLVAEHLRLYRSLGSFDSASNRAARPSEGG